MQRRQFLYFFIALLAVTFVFSTMPVMAKSTSDSSTTSSSKTHSTSKARKTKKKSKKATKTSKRKTGKVNINTADAKTLTEFTGIGPVTAKKIVAYRRKNGKFKTAKDLMNVKGIGEKTLQKMKPQLKF